MAKVNATLDRLKKSGELESLKEKWLADVITQATEKRKRHAEEEALKKAPKSITVSIVKSSGAFSMDRLDGFQLVLEGPNGTFQSAPILTNGNRGSCRFPQRIPPGEYKMAMSIFKMTTNVKVPELAKNSIAMDMRVSAKGIEIDFK
jgi:hypothetical protein